MGKKHLKRYFTSYVIREMQIKTTLRYQDRPIRTAKIQNTDHTKCSWGCEAAGTLIHCWWECKMVQPLWETVWQFLTKLNILLLHDPAIVLFGIYSKELKTYVHTKTCTHIFIIALFIIAKAWKQPRCSSIGEQINCGTSTQWTIIHCQKEMRYQVTKRHRETLNAYY